MPGLNNSKSDSNIALAQGASAQPSTDSNMYRDAQRAFQRKQIQLELLLKDLLETEIHNREFTAKHRDPETGLYRMPAEEKAAGNLTHEQKMISYYKKSINWLIQLQAVLGRVGILHTKALKVRDGGLLRNLSTANSLRKNGTLLLDEYLALYNTTEALELKLFIESLSSFSEFRQLAGKLIPFDASNTVDRMKNNALYLALNRERDSWKNLFTKSADRLLAAQKILTDLLQELPPNGRERQAAMATLLDLNAMIQEITVFSRGKNELKNTMTFIWHALPKVTSLIKNFPQAFVSVDEVIGERLLEAATQINAVLQDIIVGVDQVEIRYLLKEGSLLKKTFTSNEEKPDLTVEQLFNAAQNIPGIIRADFTELSKNSEESKSDRHEEEANLPKFPDFNLPDIDITLTHVNLDLIDIDDPIEDDIAGQDAKEEQDQPASESQSIQSMCKKFNDFIEGLGYQFKEHDRFPYTRAILEKREQIFAESKQEGAAVRNLLEIRCRNASAASIEAEATRHALEAKKTAHMTARQREIIATITRRIATLNKHKTSWFARSAIARDKASLLTELRTQLATRSLNDALDNIANQPRFRATYYLLWKDTEKDNLHQFKLLTAKPEDRVSAIDLAILQLERDRKRFFIRHEKLERRITVLKALKTILNKPGITVEFALDKLNASNRKYYGTLISNETSLIKTLRKIDTKITNIPGHADLLIGKKPLTLLNKTKKHTPDHLARKLAEIIRRYTPDRAGQAPEELLALQRLKAILQENTFNLAQAIDQLKTEYNHRNNISLHDLLIVNPSTAKVLDELHILNQKINATNEETATQSNHSTLSALALLKSTLAQAAYTDLDHALDYIRENNKDSHLLLSWKAAPLLESVKQINKEMVRKLAANPDGREAADISRLFTQQNRMIRNMSMTIQQKLLLDIKINDQIRTLENEIRRAWITKLSSTKQNKVALLKSVKARLLTSSLDTALADIARDERFAKTAHLLRDGRTGEIINAALSSDELLANIHAEINRLKNERNQSLYFFADRRRNDIRKSIDALNLLKDKLTDPTCDNVRAVLLEDRHKEHLTILTTKMPQIWSAFMFMHNSQSPAFMPQQARRPA